MLLENFKMALVSIKNAKLRSFLTMLGMVIGVSAVVAIVAIGNGVKAGVTSQVSGLGSNVLSITSGQPLGSNSKNKSSQKSGFNPASSLGTSTLTTSDVDTVSRTRHITHTAPLGLISGIVSKGTQTSSSAIVATTNASYNDIRLLKLEKGRFITNSDNNANVIVLGKAVQSDLFGTEEAVGKTVSFRNTPLTVIGVLTSVDSGASLGGAASGDNFAYIPEGTAKTIAGTTPQIMRILTQVDKPENVTPTVNALKTALKTDHGGQEDFSVLTQADLLSTFNTILNLLTTFIVAIASISLIVGGIGIMNIMLVSVTERTREIGIRKALGATNSTVLTQFLIEAITISLLGGIIGLIVAYFEATVAGKLAKIQPVFTPDVIFVGFGISVVVGIIFGIAPAIKAARKRPIEALRHE